jgi:hypothetical protein
MSRKLTIALAYVVLLFGQANAQSARGALNMAVGQLSIGTMAIQVVTARPERIRIAITNGTTTNVWCGPDNTVTATTGDVVQGTTNQTPGHIKEYDYQGAIWCISTGTNVISFYELW